MSKCGVLIVNTGTPEAPTPRAVKKYLGSFLADPRICPMNRVVWWFILHWCILPSRSKKSAAKYELIWTPEGSPLKTTHEALAEGLDAYYCARDLPVEVRYAMSYGSPAIVDALRELIDAGCDELVVLPLYPQSAFSTTGAVSDGVARAVSRLRWDGPVVIIDNYHEDSRYIAAVAASVTRAGFDPASDDRLLFSYHSIPLVDIEAGDTYELQTGATSLAIANELGLERRRWTIGYQCQFDKGRTWLSPFSRSILSGWADSESAARVFVVCPNFAVDCLETLYDVEYELKREYLAHPSRTAESFVYVPCLNKSRAHVRVLAHVLAPYVHDEVE